MHPKPSQGTGDNWRFQQEKEIKVRNWFHEKVLGFVSGMI